MTAGGVKLDDLPYIVTPIILIFVMLGTILFGVAQLVEQRFRNLTLKVKNLHIANDRKKQL